MTGDPCDEEQQHSTAKATAFKSSWDLYFLTGDAWTMHVRTLDLNILTASRNSSRGLGLQCLILNSLQPPKILDFHHLLPSPADLYGSGTSCPWDFTPDHSLDSLLLL